MTKETVLITGATSGIGFELAKLFAKDGYPLVIVSRDQDKLENVAGQLRQLSKTEVTVIAKDLFNAKAAQEVYQETKAKNLNIGILVNNAGQGQYGLFAESDLQRELDIIQLNICSLVSLTHCFLQDFKSNGKGKILNLSSIASKSPGPWQAVYHATKAFVQSFTEAIRSELKETDITVTALLPGATDTDFFNKADMNASKITQDKSKMSNPADVAKDGYEALMNNDDMVVSGFKNKANVAMSGVTPDEMLANNTNKMQQPAKKAS